MYNEVQTIPTSFTHTFYTNSYVWSSPQDQVAFLLIPTSGHEDQIDAISLF